MALVSLLSARLVIVTGKGGTGKTTMAAALGAAAARRGKRVLLVEMGRDEHIPRLFRQPAPVAGGEGCDLAPGLRALQIEPFTALAEYLGQQIGIRAVADGLVALPAFRQLMDASPGWRELITLGKIWHLEQQSGPDGAPSTDLIVVDAPSTGHGITFLDIPRVVISAVRAGPLRRHVGWVEALVRDHKRTRILPVALPEELPARETAELVARLQGEMDLAVDRVVINGVLEASLAADCEDLADRLAAVPASLCPAPLPSPAALAASTRFLRSRTQLQRQWIERIAHDVALPVIEVPWITGGVGGATALASLGERILADEGAPT